MRFSVLKSPSPMLMAVVPTISPVQLQTVRAREKIQGWFDVTWTLVTKHPPAVSGIMLKSVGDLTL